MLFKLVLNLGLCIGKAACLRLILSVNAYHCGLPQAKGKWKSGATILLV